MIIRLWIAHGVVVIHLIHNPPCLWFRKHPSLQQFGKAPTNDESWHGFSSSHSNYAGFFIECLWWSVITCLTQKETIQKCGMNGILSLSPLENVSFGNMTKLSNLALFTIPKASSIIKNQSISTTKHYQLAQKWLNMIWTHAALAWQLCQTAGEILDFQLAEKNILSARLNA